MFVFLNGDISALVIIYQTIDTKEHVYRTITIYKAHLEMVCYFVTTSKKFV